MPKYDAKEVSVQVAGQLLTGFADGDFVSIVYNADIWTTTVGADGEGVQSKSNDRSAQITITVLPTSPVNAILSGLLEDGVTKVPVPLSVIDPNTNSSHVTEGARIKKVPDKAYGKEASPIAWVFETIRLIPFIGGSTEVI